RPGIDFLAGPGAADDDRHAPAAVAALERLAHEVDVADALEAVIGAAVGETHEVLHQIAAHLLRIHEVSHAEALGKCLAALVDVDTDDPVGADQAQPLDDVEADAAQAEYHGVR